MVEQATSTRPEQGSRANEVEALREELAASREEVLRLRDLLIARDAELGGAQGRLAELESSPLHLFHAVNRLRALIPGIVWKALAAVNGLRK